MRFTFTFHKWGYTFTISVNVKKSVAATPEQ